MQPPAPPPPVTARSRLPRGVIVTTAVLGVVASLLGQLRWPRPVWTPDSGWMVTHVPAPLLAFVLAMAVVCLAAAVVLTIRAAHLRMADSATWLWIALVIVAAAALVWNALYAAALSTIEFGALIPIFHWLFTFAPAVLAGWLFARHAREVRWVASLGTGVVTLPMLALSFALLSPQPSSAGVVGTLGLVAGLGVAPLVGGVALAGMMGGDPARWKR